MLMKKFILREIHLPNLRTSIKIIDVRASSSSFFINFITQNSVIIFKMQVKILSLLFAYIFLLTYNFSTKFYIIIKI